MSRHIPGNPPIVYRNMPAGGGRQAMNHVYNVAPPTAPPSASRIRNIAFDPLFGEDGDPASTPEADLDRQPQQRDAGLRRPGTPRRSAPSTTSARRKSSWARAGRPRPTPSRPAAQPDRRHQDAPHPRLQRLERASTSRWSAARCRAAAGSAGTRSSRATQHWIKDNRSPSSRSSALSQASATCRTSPRSWTSRKRTEDRQLVDLHAGSAADGPAVLRAARRSGGPRARRCAAPSTPPPRIPAFLADVEEAEGGAVFTCRARTSKRWSGASMRRRRTVVEIGKQLSAGE